MDAELIVKLVPEEYRYGYKFNRQAIVTSPGKFEGEHIATLYYYDCFLNGGEAVFEITDEERQAFDIDPEYRAVYLYESEYGFVSSHYCSDMEEAESMQADEYIEDDEYSY